MDTPSQNVTAFLEVLQDALRQLGQVWAHYRQLGTQPNRPVLSLGRRENETARGVRGSIQLALPIRGTDGRSYDLPLNSCGVRNAGASQQVLGWTRTQARISSASFRRTPRRTSVPVWNSSARPLTI